VFSLSIFVRIVDSLELFSPLLEEDDEEEDEEWAMSYFFISSRSWPLIIREFLRRS